MLSPGDQRPEPDPATEIETVFGDVHRVVPTSGLQFLDVVVPRGAADGVVRRFAERRLDVPGGAVWALADPTSDAPATLSLDAAAVLRAARETWLPIPLLRFVARDGAGKPLFDAGPTNWARLYLSTQPDTERIGAKAVILLDTEIEARSRFDLDVYTSPSADDVRFGSTFAFTDDAEALAPFLAADWVQVWIGRIFETLDRQRAPGIAPKTAALGPVAAYLTLLTILRRAAIVPGIQFIAPTVDGLRQRPVDLIVDLGTSRTAAMLVDGAVEGAQPEFGHAQLLGLRDLSAPTSVHGGAMASGIAFARAEFGPESLSRRSGRTDAFRWPSLARLGPEAERLASLAPSRDGGGGVRTPKAYIADLEPRVHVWRFAPDPRQPTGRRPMLAGPLLAVPSTIAGLLPTPEGASRALSAPVRPRFSLSSTISFAIVELVSQALAAINTPTPADTTMDAVPRRLRQIIIAVPLATPVAERQLLRERAEAAIDMLWSAHGWRGGGVAHAPAPPTVRLGLDETLCAQLVHLYDEVAERFAGHARACFDTWGKQRPEFGVQPSLRVGAIDVGGGHAHATIVTFTMRDTGLAPVLFGTQRSALGGEDVLDRIAAAVLGPALAAALTLEGRPDAAATVARLLDPVGGDAFVRERWMLPAALTLLAWLDGSDPAAFAVERSTSLARLSGASGPRTTAAVAALDAQAGLGGSIADLPLRISLAAVADTVRTTLEPTVSDLLSPMLASGCDVVLLSGWFARLPLLRELVVAHMPWRPDRILDMTATVARPWAPLQAEALASVDGKAVVLLGSLLALGGGDRFGLGAFDAGSAPDLDAAAQP